MRLNSILVWLAAAAFALQSCGPKTENNEAEGGENDRRVVSVGSSLTEIMYGLGKGDLLVARDVTSKYPEAAHQLPDLGYIRSISAEGVLRYKPTDLLISAEAKPDLLDQLKQAGVTVHTFDADTKPEDVKQTIQKVGKIFGEEDKAKAMVAQLKADLGKAKAYAAEAAQTPRVLFVYARGKGNLYVAGKNTAAQTMLELAGAQNAITEFEDFQPLTSEAVVKANPDIILMPEKGLASLGGAEAAIESVPGLKLTEAGRKGRVLAMDDVYLLGFGPRLGQAALDLAKLLHDKDGGKSGGSH